MFSQEADDGSISEESYMLHMVLQRLSGVASGFPLNDKQLDTALEAIFSISEEQAVRSEVRGQARRMGVFKKIKKCRQSRLFSG